MASHQINALSQRMDALHARLSNRVVKLETSNADLRNTIAALERRLAAATHHLARSPASDTAAKKGETARSNQASQETALELAIRDRELWENKP